MPTTKNALNAVNHRKIQNYSAYVLFAIGVLLLLFFTLVAIVKLCNIITCVDP